MEILSLNSRCNAEQVFPQTKIDCHINLCDNVLKMFFNTLMCDTD
jgi:hypothetical protein